VVDPAIDRRAAVCGSVVVIATVEKFRYWWRAEEFPGNPFKARTELPTGGDEEAQRRGGRWLASAGKNEE